MFAPKKFRLVRRKNLSSHQGLRFSTSPRARDLRRESFPYSLIESSGKVFIPFFAQKYSPGGLIAANQRVSYDHFLEDLVMQPAWCRFTIPWLILVNYFSLPVYRGGAFCLSLCASVVRERIFVKIKTGIWTPHRHVIRAETSHFSCETGEGFGIRQQKRTGKGTGISTSSSHFRTGSWS